MQTNTEQDLPLRVWPIAAIMGMFFANAIPHAIAGILILNLPTLLLFSALRNYWTHRAVRMTAYVSAAVFFMFVTWAIGSMPLPGRFI